MTATAALSLVTLLGSLLVLVGCAPSWKIVGAPAGMTRQQAARILADCQASGPAAYPTTNAGVAYAQVRNQDAAYRLCLEANGIQTADK
jgi:hypothetical protein